MMNMGHLHHNSEGDEGVNRHQIWVVEAFYMCPNPPPPCHPIITENYGSILVGTTSWEF